MDVNWYELAIRVGSIDATKPNSESGNDNIARKAIEQILGGDFVNHAVTHAISGRKGSELAMNCLRLLSSGAGCETAYEIYKSSTGEKAAECVWLIKHIANPSSLKWVEEFIEDDNVRGWAIEIIDNLLFQDKIQFDDNIERLLQIAERKSDEDSNSVKRIRESLSQK